MMPISLAGGSLLMLSLLSCGGCSLFAQRDPVLLNPSIPHRLAEPCDAVTWGRGPDGVTMVKTSVRLEAGWWVASPEVISMPPEDPPTPHDMSNLGTQP